MPVYFVRCPDGTCSARAGSTKDPDEPSETDSLSGSVGEGGKNLDADVRNVQSRLNRVSSADGGPYEALAVDGISGPRTKAAIKRFQQRYWQELLGDGRIDVGQATWRKLLTLSDSAGRVEAKTPVGAAGDGDDDAATQQLFVTYLYLSRWRVYAAVQSLDTAKEEWQVCIAHQALHPGTSLFSAYQLWEPKMKELPTVNRCFHLVDDKVESAVTLERIRRIRKVFTDMLDVIIANSFTTPAAEKDGSRRYLRVVKQAVLDNVHGKNGAIADADAGGWWKKNANLGRIRYGTGYLDDGGAFSTLIHEMAHFVSHETTYPIDHNGGFYAKALEAKRSDALRNAFCYEYFALLAAHKSLRALSNEMLSTHM